MSNTSNQANRTNQQNQPPISRSLVVDTTKTLEEHQANLVRIEKERDKTADVRRRCLDSSVAARYESSKPLFDYEVKASFLRRNTRGGMDTVKKTREVRAQSEDEAWAKFCDEIRDWPSRKAAQVEIQQLTAV